jgi:hypothetical protein
VATQTPVTNYFCPSRRTRNSPSAISTAGQDANGSKGATGDYAACIGTTGDDIANIALSPYAPNGAFQVSAYGSGLPRTQISDGLSNTFLVGEKHVPFGKFGTLAGYDCSIFDGENTPNPYASCSLRSAGVGGQDLRYGQTLLATTVNDTGWKFGSYHPGICQFAFCDGSVQAISTTINLATGPAMPAYQPAILPGQTATPPFQSAASAGYILDLLANIADGQPMPQY